MKKILSILAIICLSAVVAPSVFAACDPACVAPQTCVDDVCVSPSTADTPFFGISNCVKISNGFKVNMYFEPGATEKTEITFSPGQIIAEKGADKTSCKFADGGVTTKCSASGGSGACYMPQTGQIGVVGMLNTIYSVTNWIFYIMTLLAVVFIVFGGFTVLTAAGDPAKATKGKGMLTYAVIGLAIALVAKFLPSLVKFILNV